MTPYLILQLKFYKPTNTHTYLHLSKYIVGTAESLSTATTFMEAFSFAAERSCENVGIAMHFANCQMSPQFVLLLLSQHKTLLLEFPNTHRQKRRNSSVLATDLH